MINKRVLRVFLRIQLEKCRIKIHLIKRSSFLLFVHAHSAWHTWVQAEFNKFQLLDLHVQLSSSLHSKGLRWGVAISLFLCR